MPANENNNKVYHLVVDKDAHGLLILAFALRLLKRTKNGNAVHLAIDHNPPKKMYSILELRKFLDKKAGTLIVADIPILSDEALAKRFDEEVAVNFAEAYIIDHHPSISANVEKLEHTKAILTDAYDMIFKVLEIIKPDYDEADLKEAEFFAKASVFADKDGVAYSKHLKNKFVIGSKNFRRLERYGAGAKEMIVSLGFDEALLRLVRAKQPARVLAQYGRILETAYEEIPIEVVNASDTVALLQYQYTDDLHHLRYEAIQNFIDDISKDSSVKYGVWLQPYKNYVLIFIMKKHWYDSSENLYEKLKPLEDEIKDVEISGHPGLSIVTVKNPENLNEILLKVLEALGVRNPEEFLSDTDTALAVMEARDRALNSRYTVSDVAKLDRFEDMLVASIVAKYKNKKDKIIAVYSEPLERTVGFVLNKYAKKFIRIGCKRPKLEERIEEEDQGRCKVQKKIASMVSMCLGVEFEFILEEKTVKKTCDRYYVFLNKRLNGEVCIGGEIDWIAEEIQKELGIKRWKKYLGLCTDKYTAEELKEWIKSKAEEKGVKATVYEKEQRSSFLFI